MKKSPLNTGIKKSFIKIITVITVILSAYNSYSQSKSIFVIDPGQKITDVISPAEMYRYADFKPGTVIFKDKRESSALLNYNLVLNEFQFINAGGDTLSLADESLIKLIKVDSDTFFYNKGYYKLVNNFDYVRLVKKEVIYKSAGSKIGAYGQPVQGGSVSSYTNFSSGSRNINLQVNEKITLKKEASFYFVDSYDHITIASKKFLQREFPRYNSVIEEFTKTNATDFKKEADLEKLFSYLEAYKF